MTPAHRSTGPSLQPGEINYAGNVPELAVLHRHRPVVTSLAECTGPFLPFHSFLVMGRLPIADDTRFLVRPAIYRS